MNTPPKPGIRRIVTGHDPQGQSIVKQVNQLPGYEFGPARTARFMDVWTTDRMPADNNTLNLPPERFATLSNRTGTVLRIVDMLPGEESPMHRTNSVDYGIVLAGELDMDLDDGSCTHLTPGDVVIQRGTNHRWVNRSSQVTRVAFVLVAADPVVINGQPLVPSH
jgi:quercetin dioxygenase-like cupin family protein